MSFAGGRSPFRPLQQPRDPMHATVQQSARLRDSPMDFAYDSPSRQRPSTSSTWLDAHSTAPSLSGDDGTRKRTRDPSVAHRDQYVFGAAEGSEAGTSNSTGAFLFHQPLSPTLAGPDVEMTNETPPRQAVEGSKDSARGDEDEGEEYNTKQSGRRLASQGALTRIGRHRAAHGKRLGNGQTRRRRISTSRAKATEDGDEDEGDDVSGGWEDEREIPDNKGKVRSLRKRMGDTLNIQYFINGPGRDSQAHGGHHLADQKAHQRSLLDPEWCLGMAQFGFNATLLLGTVWILFHVVRTLQRDVSSKVREYELEYLAEIEACSQSFHLNRCGTAGAVPALASACASWQRCSARDPTSVGRARVAAETVAEIVNGFVDVVSWKSMMFTLLSMIIVVGATNSFLSFFRIRSRQAQHTQQPPGTRATVQADGHDAMPPHGYDPRAIRPPFYPYTHAPWHASPPVTPSSKRMCR